MVVVREWELDDGIDEVEEEEEEQRVCYLACEPETCGVWCEGSHDGSAGESPYLGPEVEVDDGEFGDEAEDG